MCICSPVCSHLYKVRSFLDPILEFIRILWCCFLDGPRSVIYFPLDHRKLSKTSFATVGDKQKKDNPANYKMKVFQQR